MAFSVEEVGGAVVLVVLDIMIMLSLPRFAVLSGGAGKSSYGPISVIVAQLREIRV